MSAINSGYGDRVAECYSRYGDTLLRVIGGLVENRHQAEEILQDLFLKLYERRFNLDPLASTTRSYLITAARNQVFDHLRKNRHEIRNVTNADMDALEIEDFGAGLEESYIEGEVISTLREVLDLLPELERTVFIRRKLMEHTVPAIAADTGLSIYRVNGVVRRVEHVLKKAFNERFPA